MRHWSYTSAMAKKPSPARPVGDAHSMVKVSNRGQVVIPAAIRSAVGITGGTNVVFTSLPDGRVLMRAKSGTLADLKGIVKTNRHATDAEIRNLTAAKARRRVRSAEAVGPVPAVARGRGASQGVDVQPSRLKAK